MRVGMSTAHGTVAGLWRWPVKSMAGERVNALRLDRRGAGGDRTHAVTHVHKGERTPLTAREAPRLLAWRASYPFNTGGGLDPARPPFATVTAPDGHSYRWGDPRLRTQARGRPRPPRAAAARRRGDPRRAAHAAGDDAGVARCARRRARRPGRPAPVPDQRAPGHGRAAWDDLRWEGADLAFSGGVRLRSLHPCERCAIPTRHPDTQIKWPGLLRHLAATHDQCFGINARVLTGGRLAVGETASLRLPLQVRAGGR